MFTKQKTLVIFTLFDNGAYQMLFEDVRWNLRNDTCSPTKFATLKLRNVYTKIIKATFDFSIFLLIVLQELTPFPFLPVDVAP